jgi:hypothetical protein
MLSKFNNEVLSKGAAAVLPQNLNSGWLKRLQKITEDFLDSNFSLDECKDPQDIADPILSTCIYEILIHQGTNMEKVSIEKMIQKMAIYAVSVAMEAANRESAIGLEPPTLDNLLSMDRIIAYKEINPDLIKLLEQACILRSSDKKENGNE